MYVRIIQFTFEEDVRSLTLPGSYHEKVTHLGRSLAGFTRLKHLDLSRNAICSLQVIFIILCKIMAMFTAGFGTFTFTGDLKPVSSFHQNFTEWISLTIVFGC